MAEATRPAATRLFVGSVSAAGVAAVAYSVSVLVGSTLPGEWVLFALLTIGSGMLTVKVPSIDARVSVSEAFAFASVLLAIFGLDWARHPAIGPALLVGIGSVAAPFLIMQPGMGFGIAASRMPNPAAARVRSLVMHGVFGVGLYLTGCVASLLES